jgi:hypothetical protein
MASVLKAIIECVTGSDPDSATEQFPNEKQIIISGHSRTAEEIADEVTEAILNAEKGGEQLRRTLDTIVGEYGWTEKVAEWTLAKLEQALNEASKLGPALKEAYDKTLDIAQGIEGFIKEHPVFCTIIALGVLVIIAPWAIEALGFGELGPIEGTSIIAGPRGDSLTPLL